MKKMCDICGASFETKSSTRIYCYDCSGDSTRNIYETRKNQKTILRRSMKLHGIKNKKQPVEFRPVVWVLGANIH